MKEIALLKEEACGKPRAVAETNRPGEESGAKLTETNRVARGHELPRWKITNVDIDNINNRFY